MFGKKRPPGDFRAEIDAHLQIEADRLREQGAGDTEAGEKARRTFGNRTRAEERFYESSLGVWRDRLAQNIRFGIRMLARNPGATLVAVLTLAVGIGANTAIFTLLHAVVLRSLPVRSPGELVLFGKGRWTGSVDSLPEGSWQLFSYASYKDFRQKNRVYSDVAAIDSIMFDTHGRVVAGTALERIGVELVSGTYFDTLGVNPALGRVLHETDDRNPGGHPVAVASYSWWQRRLGGKPEAVGTTVTFGSTIYTIIGVSEPGFFGVTVGQSPDVWIPLAMEKEISPGWNGLENKMFQSLYIFARRRPGVAMESASANTNLLFKQILRDYVGPQPSAKQLEDIRHASIDLTPAATGLSQIRRQYSSPLELLMVVVALLLLIACANVANLLLARAAARQREMAIRMSIGAGRSRLIRQLLVESSLLGFLGAALGILLASLGSELLLRMVSPESRPLPISIAPDAPVLAFTVAVTLATVFLFGSAPAFGATRLDLAPALREGRASLGPARSRLARGLVIAQVALSLLLLAGAGLFLRSLQNLLKVPTGFNRENVLVLGVDPTGTGYKADSRLEKMMRRAEEQVAAIPGVQSAAFAFSVFDGGGWTDPVTVPGRPASPNDPEVFQNIVGTQYLRAIQTPIVLGRGFDARDDGSARRVAIINETFARLYFPNTSPLGRTFNVGKDPDWQDIEVAGVAKDAMYMQLGEKQMAAAFYPHSQHLGYLYRFVVRYSSSQAAVVPRIRRAFAEIDPNLPVGDVSPLSKLVSAFVKNQRLVAQLTTLFGAIAAFLACIGIYGLMSYGVARRTNELGIRMALGAQGRDVLGLVLREVSGLVLAGVGAGLALVLAASRLLGSLVFEMQSVDPLSLGLATIIMVGVALLAGYLPARRATRINPTVALRCE